MLKLAWRGVRHNPGRYVATLVAILTGVAFFTATGLRLRPRHRQPSRATSTASTARVDVAVVADDDDGRRPADFAEQAAHRRAGRRPDRRPPTGVEAGGGHPHRARSAFLGADGKTFADGATGRLWVEDEELNPLEVDGGRGAAGGRARSPSTRASPTTHDLAVGADGHACSRLAGQSDGDDRGHHEVRQLRLDRRRRHRLDPRGDRLRLAERRARSSTRTSTCAARATRPTSPAAVEPLRARRASRPRPATSFLERQARARSARSARSSRTRCRPSRILALLVGAFVIYNTFSVIVAQRLREIAVLSAIGATPKQIRRSLRCEGVVVGAARARCSGVLAGHRPHLRGRPRPARRSASRCRAAASKVGPSDVVQGILIGTVITVASVMIPARRAARTEPIEALRDAAVETQPVLARRGSSRPSSCVGARRRRAAVRHGAATRRARRPARCSSA